MCNAILKNWIQWHWKSQTNLRLLCRTLAKRNVVHLKIFEKLLHNGNDFSVFRLIASLLKRINYRVAYIYFNTIMTLLRMKNTLFNVLILPKIASTSIITHHIYINSNLMCARVRVCMFYHILLKFSEWFAFHMHENWEIQAMRCYCPQKHCDNAIQLFIVIYMTVLLIDFRHRNTHAFHTLWKSDVTQSTGHHYQPTRNVNKDGEYGVSDVADSGNDTITIQKMLHSKPQINWTKCFRFWFLGLALSVQWVLLCLSTIVNVNVVCSAMFVPNRIQNECVRDGKIGYSIR